MASYYIVDFEVWLNGTQMSGWGNFNVTIPHGTNAPSADQFHGMIKAEAARLGQCKEQHIRIKGIFKL